MKTLEEIARKYADAVVIVRDMPTGSRVLEISPGVFMASTDAVEIDNRASVCREHVAPLFLAAIEEALLRTPLSGGMTDARLAAIKAGIGRVANVAAVPSNEDAVLAAEVCPWLRDAVAEVELCRRVLSDAAADGVSAALLREAREAGRREGWAAGARAQKDADATETPDDAECKGWCADAVMAAPLVPYREREEGP